jgi:SAM-dependent methyltransferase
MREQPPDLFSGTAWYYARYRKGYPDEFIQHLVERFRLDGEGRLLDLGCGTGQLTIPLAAHVAEAVGLDPEPEMLAEAARAAERAGAGNLRWLLGSDRDLERLAPEIGPLRLATMARSFHWMRQDETLRTLDRLIEPGGGVVVAGDHERIWDVEGGWQLAAREVIARWLGPVRRAGSGVRTYQHDPFEVILDRSPFSPVETYQQVVTRGVTLDEIIGHLYSTSYCSPHVLGDKREGFEADLRRTLLALHPDGDFSERVELGAWLAFRST